VVAAAAGVVGLLLAGSASAQTGSATSSPATDQKPVSAFEEMLKKSKNPVPWLKLGADARLREVFTPNLLLDQEDRHFQRYRERAWLTLTPIENVDINARLVYEPRHFCQPSRIARMRNEAYIDEWTLSEGIFDLMNVEWKKAFGLPLTLKVGRQELVTPEGRPAFGDAWLILDGTPLDGSRTIFFDAARATYEAKEINTVFDLIFICQEADSQVWLPVFCDKDFHNIEQNERGVIVYASNKSLPKTQIDGYFIYKHDEQVLGARSGDVGAGHMAPWQVGANSDIYAFGGRVAGDITDNWKYRAEGAYEFGEKNGNDLSAFGFNSRLSYHFKDPLDNSFRVGYEYLSGDNRNTAQNEQFDQLWGRWPQWSELYVYTVGLENRPGEITNLHRVGTGWSCKPVKDVDVAVDYHLLFRDQDKYPGRAYFDGGCFRGSLLTGVAKYKINDHISTHVWAELFFPGDFYSNNNNEVGGFFRYEIVFSW
jgi:hypothetical protein